MKHDFWLRRREISDFWKGYPEISKEWITITPRNETFWVCWILCRVIQIIRGVKFFEVSRAPRILVIKMFQGVYSYRIIEIREKFLKGFEEKIKIKEVQNVFREKKDPIIRKNAPICFKQWFMAWQRAAFSERGVKKFPEYISILVITKVLLRSVIAIE